MRDSNRGQLVAATWLIGLGIVFLVQQATGTPWSQAWPLFIILVGAATLVSEVLQRRHRGSGLWAYTFPVAWIAVGSVLLASTTGRLSQSPGDLIVTWGPWFLIVLGAWFVLGAILPRGHGPVEQLELGLDGATQAAVRIRFGAGELSARAAAPGHLVDGRYEGGVDHRVRGPGQVELTQDTTYGIPWFDRRSSWDVGLTAEVPLDLRLDTGASRANLDLGGLRLRSLELKTGASETRVRLPRAAGATNVWVEAGVASVTLEVPPGVAARIRTSVGLGSIQVDQARFPRTTSGYESPDFATATDRIDIDLRGGVGTLRVVGGV